MRLGDATEVTTGTEGSGRWNVLSIDWNDFANAADDDIGHIAIKPTKGSTKESTQKGTRVRIIALSSPWSYKKLEDLAREYFFKVS